MPRTLVKIKDEYHTKAADFDGPRWVNQGCKDPGAARRNVAIVSSCAAPRTLLFYSRPPAGRLKPRSLQVGIVGKGSETGS